MLFADDLRGEKYKGFSYAQWDHTHLEGCTCFASSFLLFCSPDFHFWVRNQRQTNSWATLSAPCVLLACQSLLRESLSLSALDIFHVSFFCTRKHG